MATQVFRPRERYVEDRVGHPLLGRGLAAPGLCAPAGPTTPTHIG